jgi:hypothetical protein
MSRIEGANLDEAVGYVKLPPGVHLVEITEIEEGLSKAKERKIDVTFTVLEVGSDDPVEKQKAGGRVGMSLSLQAKALWKFRQLRDASGTPSTAGDFVETNDFLGRKLKIATSMKPYTDDTGKTVDRTNIDDFMSAA